MSRRLSLLLAAITVLLVVGAGAATASRGLPARVTWFEDPAHEPGAVVPGGYATQQRGYFSITARVLLTSLTPGHRYTLWWVIYNDPASCVEGCGFDDVTVALATGVNPVKIGVHFGGIFTSGSSGKMGVGTQILEDRVNGCQISLPYSSLCQPLIDAAVAEATIFVHDHGPAGAIIGPFVVTEGFTYGCQNYRRFDAVVATDAETAYECFSPQSVHLP